jgi:hypothetical protein
VSVRNGVTVRGSSNGNERGSSKARAARKAWLLETYAADERMVKVTYEDGRAIVYHPGRSGSEFRYWTSEIGKPPFPGISALVVAAVEETPTCRCYRCGDLLHEGTVTVDRIIPGCKGGTYRRTNIRPACGGCNSVTGGSLRSDSGPSVR